MDRRRNSNREAIRNLKNLAKSGGKTFVEIITIWLKKYSQNDFNFNFFFVDFNEKKIWIAIGNTFLEIKGNQALERLEQVWNFGNMWFKNNYKALKYLGSKRTRHFNQQMQKSFER